MTFIKSGILLAGAASLLVLTACNSADSTGGAAPGKDGVAATVNGTPIREHLVGGMLKERAGLGRGVTAEARNNLIDRLARQVVITDAAVKKGLDKQPEVVDKLELARLSILTDAFIDDYFKNNPVSDDTLKAEYEKFSAREAGTEYKAKHILVDNEADAAAIVAKLKADPKAFEVLAKAKSKDGGSKIRGGDLGWFDLRAVVPEFGKAVAALAKGQVTAAPVKSQFGYHVILLEDSRTRQVPPLEQVKAQFTEQVKRQNLDKLIDEMKAKATIVVAPAPVPGPTEAKPGKKEAGAADPDRN